MGNVPPPGPAGRSASAARDGNPTRHSCSVLTAGAMPRTGQGGHLGVSPPLVALRGHCCQQSVGWKRGREDGARHGEGARAVRGDVRPGLSMGMWHQAQSMGVGHQGRPWGNETKKHPWGCDSGQYPWGCDTKRRPRRCDSRAVRGAVTAGTRCPAKERGWPRGHRAEADGAGTAPAAARKVSCRKRCPQLFAHRAPPGPGAEHRAARRH